MEGGLRQYEQIIGWLLLGCWLAGCQPNDRQTAAAGPAYVALTDTALIATGDLVLRLGDGFYSLFFRNMSTRERRFSHVGIAVVERGQVFVIHAEADERTGIGGVRSDPVGVFLKQAIDWGVYRIRAPATDRSAIARAAQDYLARATPFDMDFDAADTTRLYCSELVMHCVNRAVRGHAMRATTQIQGRLFVAIDETYLNESTYKVRGQ